MLSPTNINKGVGNGSGPMEMDTTQRPATQNAESSSSMLLAHCTMLVEPQWVAMYREQDFRTVAVLHNQHRPMASCYDMTV